MVSPPVLVVGHLKFDTPPFIVVERVCVSKTASKERGIGRDHRLRYGSSSSCAGYVAPEGSAPRYSIPKGLGVTLGGKRSLAAEARGFARYTKSRRLSFKSTKAPNWLIVAGVVKILTLPLAEREHLTSYWTVHI